MPWAPSTEASKLLVPLHRPERHCLNDLLLIDILIPGYAHMIIAGKQTQTTQIAMSMDAAFSENMCNHRQVGYLFCS